PHPPHQQAGHVTAPDQCCTYVKKALAMAPSTRDPKRTLHSIVGMWANDPLRHALRRAQSLGSSSAAHGPRWGRLLGYQPLSWWLIMRRFHCAALAAVAVFGFASVASAADMPVKAPVYTPAFNWTGCYVGIEGGGTLGHSEHALPNGFIFSDFDMRGGLIGGTIGCNYQTGNWV